MLAARGTMLAVRGEIVHFTADPALHGDGACAHHPDGVLLIRDGHVLEAGDATSLLQQLPAETQVIDHRGKLLMPGFVDTHVHYSQTDIIASHGVQLLDWLERYTFPAERGFEDHAHASEVASFFLDELLKNGTTTAAVYATVHPVSVDAFFEAAAKRSLRMACGKVLMDRNCPEYLRDTAESGYADSRALIRRWHGHGRLAYAVTPRFAPTSTEHQLGLAGRLLDEHPGVLFQTHLAENRGEVEWVGRLYPRARSYLDVYDHFGTVRHGSVFAHCIHLDDTDRHRMAEQGAAMSFCPTSNLFLGSGLFDLRKAVESGVTVGVGTDIGGGTTLSMSRTLADAYKVTHLLGNALPPKQAFYLATLGGARALAMDDKIGSFAAGNEADFVVLEPDATPLQARRALTATTLDERLFVLMMLGDDRSVAATYVMGELAWKR